MKRTIGIIALVLAGILGATAQTTDNMDRIEVCKQNYRTLFGGEALTGQGTDPEMMDILQKFIFGEVFQTGELTLKQREMITCITLATMQTLPQLKAHAGAALNVGVTPEELREVMYLTAPFIGFPKMLNAVATVNEVFKERGISLPLEKQGTVTEETRHKAGKAIQDKQYPGGVSSVMSGMPGDMGKNVEQFLTDYFPVPALHRFPCCYQGVAHHQRGICQMTRIKTIFYFRYFLKNASILSNGMMSVLSYKSVWLAPGIISSSLLSPLNLAKASCEAGSE